MSWFGLMHYICAAAAAAAAKSLQSCPTLCDPMDYTVCGNLQARTLEWVAYPFSRGSSQPRDWTQVSHIAGRFLRAEPQGKPKNTGAGSLSLLQGIFLTQESNHSLLHCRWILYQQSYQGSPIIHNKNDQMNNSINFEKQNLQSRSSDYAVKNMFLASISGNSTM